MGWVRYRAGIEWLVVVFEGTWDQRWLWKKKEEKFDDFEESDLFSKAGIRSLQAEDR